jgi:hypothetical protein
MRKLTEFEYGKLPQIMYHGTGADIRADIVKNGLKAGFIIPHPDVAAEYAAPDLWEVKKHPNLVDGEDWDPKEAPYANGIPPENLRRVGHVIWHQESIGRHSENEIHWHPVEECPLGYDMTWEKNSPDSVTDFKNARPHPTDPNLMVGNY